MEWDIASRFPGVVSSVFTIPGLNETQMKPSSRYWFANLALSILSPALSHEYATIVRDLIRCTKSRSPAEDEMLMSFFVSPARNSGIKASVVHMTPSTLTRYCALFSHADVCLEEDSSRRP